MKVFLVEEGVILESAEFGTKEEILLSDKMDIMQNKGHHVYLSYEKMK